MNLILLEPEEAETPQPVVLRDRRAAHVVDVLGAVPGDTLRVGVVGGKAGHAEVIAAERGRVVISPPVLDRDPPAPWFDILLAMPRPKVLHRMWAPLASLGARRITVVNAAKVEKFYFDSHWLSPDTYAPLLREGMEQSGTTFMPQVEIRRRFRPFIEDEVPVLFADSPKLAAHPYAGVPPPKFTQDPEPGAPLPLVAIGPEGGWTDFELALLADAGFKPFSIGRRPLRTDVAAIAIISSLAAYASDACPETSK